MFCAVAGGNVHNFAITDFEATSARKAYPCFDEPQLKVRLSVSMTAHQPTARSSCAWLGLAAETLRIRGALFRGLWLGI